MTEKKKKPSATVQNKKKTLKKAVKIVLTVFAVLIILYFILGKLEASLSKANAEKKQNTKIEQMNFNPNGLLSVDYYEPDYTADIFSESDYLAKDRSIRFVANSQSIVLDEYSADELSCGQRFWKNYFEAVISGDSEAYGELFGDDYSGNPKIFGENPKNKSFPMQRIYDIEVKLLGESQSGDANAVYNGRPAVFGVYEVSYKIMKNDGEYRLGLPSDKIIPVIFEITTTDAGTSDEKTVIRRAYLYEDIEFNIEEN